MKLPVQVFAQICDRLHCQITITEMLCYCIERRELLRKRQQFLCRSRINTFCDKLLLHRIRRHFVQLIDRYNRVGFQLTIDTAVLN